VKVVIVGGGKVGHHLATVLRRERKPVVVIELDQERAEEVANETGALVIHGDGTDVRILEEADLEHATRLVAVTGSDEDNLVACQLARTAFDCPEVLARVNDPRNERTFTALNVPLVSVTSHLVQLLGQKIDLGELNRIATLGDGAALIVEVEIPANRSPVAVAALGLPDPTVLAAIRRGREVLIPDGTSQIVPGDRVVAVTMAESEERTRSVLRGEYT
jgi:trk system potassium uptake protein